MKHSILAFICTAIVSTSAFAADEFVTEVVCRDTSRIADAGYSVRIESGGFAGLTKAVVSRITIAGARPLGTVFVKKTSVRQLHKYKGEDFELTFNNDHSVVNREPGNSLLVADVGGVKLNEEMTCRFVEQRNPITCMAYWSGWEYDAVAGKCVKRGRSGCSNPFEHKTLESCQQSVGTEIM